MSDKKTIGGAIRPTATWVLFFAALMYVNRTSHGFRDLDMGFSLSFGGLFMMGLFAVIVQVWITNRTIGSSDNPMGRSLNWFMVVVYIFVALGCNHLFDPGWVERDVRPGLKQITSVPLLLPDTLILGVEDEEYLALVDSLKHPQPDETQAQQADKLRRAADLLRKNDRSGWQWLDNTADRLVGTKTVYRPMNSLLTFFLWIFGAFMAFALIKGANKTLAWVVACIIALMGILALFNIIIIPYFDNLFSGFSRSGFTTALGLGALLFMTLGFALILNWKK